VNNFTLVMFLGLCSFFGVTAKIETAWRSTGEHLRADHHGGARGFHRIWSSPGRHTCARSPSSS
jgi:hypothetical protein